MSCEVEEADVLVVGGGAAGCSVAAEAAKRGLKVVLLCKDVFGKAQTLMATEGYSAAFNREDSWRSHFIDTLNAGGWINDQTLIEALAKDAPQRLFDLEQHGALLDRLPNGDLKLLSFSGHTKPRVCTARDEIGRILMTTLAEEIYRLQIRVVGEFYVTQLMIKDGVAVGASGIHVPSGNYAAYAAKAIVLATGGGGRLFEVTSNSRGATGDGYGLALKAGATLVDMEMVQFHPTAFVYPESQKGIVITEAARVLGGVLRNKSGDRFMEEYNSELKDLAPPSEVARAILTELEEARSGRHGGAYLDLSTLDPAEIENMLPHTVTQILEAGFSLKDHPPEVAPSAHSTLGGVLINENAETSVSGLFAAGEAAGGIHGAGMLPGNGLSSALVFGSRAGAAASERASKIPPPLVDREQIDADMKHVFGVLESKDGPRASTLRRQLRAAMWANAGPVRSRYGLNSLVEQIAKWRGGMLNSLRVENKSQRHNREWIEALELHNMLLTAEALAKSALERLESRGVHHRSDHPRLDNQRWLVNSHTRMADGQIVVEFHPPAMHRITQPGGRFAEGDSD